MFFVDEYLQKVKTIKDNLAITDNDGKRSFTYGELDILTNKIANKLVALGITTGDAVIIRLPRIAEYIACEIALLKIGAAIVPLIPEYPDDRVSYIKKDCNAALIIAESFFKDISSITEVDFEASDVDDENIGMFIYTSGSTGNPKGVVYSRHAMDVHIKITFPYIDGIDPLVYAASATMSFCFTVEEYLRNLSVGAHIHMLSNEVRSDAGLLSSYYIDNKISAGFISPRIAKNFECKSDYLKRVFTGSDRVSNTYSDNYEICCTYGQSETIGPITCFMIDKNYDNTPIGKPLKGVEIIIADPDDNEVADGTEGQILIIGDFPHEYNNLKEQTQKNFKRLDDGRILVHSGDVGKKLPSGDILFVNRNDWMIKIHGQRVEPGEIEFVMNSVDGITGSIVKAFENDDGTMLLCGFYTEKKAVKRSEIIDKLKSALPSYMIPSALVRMDSFPTNANGKLDRKSIGKPDLNQLTTDYEEPIGKTEEIICGAMQEILSIKRVGRNDNFFELGGNSLNAVSLCAKCGIEGLEPPIVMTGQTPAGIAKLLSEKSFYPKPKLTVSKSVKKEYPLSSSQKYQYEVYHSLGAPIDSIDTNYFFKLGENDDIDRLKRAVEDVVNEHPIYKSHIDIENDRLFIDQTDFKVEDVSLKEDEFKDFRYRLCKRVRNLKGDPLFEGKILHIDDGSTYLFMNVCHLIYDGKSLANLMKSINAKYNGTPEEEEQASIFDQIEYECRLKEDTKLIEKTDEVFASNYDGLKASNLFDENKKCATGAASKILEGVNQTEIDTFLKDYGISILTFFQAAMEITVRKMFKVDDFCYMNVHDGRTDEKLSASHGVFAKAVFMRSGAGKHERKKDYFESIKEQYQKLVYYDVVDTFDVVEKYPAIKSGITFNFRDLSYGILKTGDEMKLTEFIDEPFEVNEPITYFDLFINRLPRSMGYTAVVASSKVSVEFANEFIRNLDENIRELLNGN